MPTNLSYPLLSQQFVDANGYLLRPWQQFFQAFFIRAGADRAMTNLELEEDVSTTRETLTTQVEDLQLNEVFAGGRPVHLAALPIEALFAPLAPSRSEPSVDALFADRGVQLSRGVKGRADSGTAVGPRPQLNFLNGGALTITVTSTAGPAELDISIGLQGSAETYSVTNLVTDRTYDADATTLAELADVLGTLIADLRARGIVA